MKSCYPENLRFFGPCVHVVVMIIIIIIKVVMITITTLPIQKSVRASGRLHRCLPSHYS